MLAQGRSKSQKTAKANTWGNGCSCAWNSDFASHVGWGLGDQPNTKGYTHPTISNHEGVVTDPKNNPGPMKVQDYRFKRTQYTNRKGAIPGTRPCIFVARKHLRIGSDLRKNVSRLFWGAEDWLSPSRNPESLGIDFTLPETIRSSLKAIPWLEISIFQPSIFRSVCCWS